MSQVGDQPATGVRDERHSPADRPAGGGQGPLTVALPGWA